MDKIVNGKVVPMTAAEEAEFNSRPNPIPQIVSRAQIKLALLQTLKLDSVETFVASSERKVKIEWAERVEYHRDNAFLKQMATAFGMTGAELDDLFKLAATL